MNASTLLRALRGTALAVLAACAVTLPLQANAATHGFSGGHAGFGGHGGGFGGYHGGYHGGYRGGYRGGYGHYGYGWRGGYYGGWGGWGWWGLPAAGLFLATLPFYYSTYWWDGVPYYYADDNYYVWSNSADGYVSVAPPPQVVSQAPAGTYPAGNQATAPYAGAAGAPNQLFVYPKNGQAADQIAKDRQECQAWAGSQASNGSDNVRAQTACLEARGYSVR
ncbi:MAG: hypothetical protein WB646_18640 [Steroidobacteraceae bacterium]